MTCHIKYIGDIYNTIMMLSPFDSFDFMFMNELLNQNSFEMIGEAILLASMQFSIGSVEMSSKFSVKNFSKDQDTLDNAKYALEDYMRIGILWTIGVALMFYAKYGTCGVIVSVMANAAIMAWIYFSYIRAFEMAATANKLVVKPVVIF